MRRKFKIYFSLLWKALWGNLIPVDNVKDMPDIILDKSKLSKLGLDVKKVLRIHDLIDEFENPKRYLPQSKTTNQKPLFTELLPFT